MTIFLGVVMAIALVIAYLCRDEAESAADRRLAVALVGLVVAISGRQLVWTYVGFEVVALTLLPVRARTMVGSAVALSGLVVVAFSSGGTDLAFLPSTWQVLVGLCLFEAGIAAKWLEWRREDPGVFAATGVAVVSLFVRVWAWAPSQAEALSLWIGVAASFAMVAAGLSAIASRERSSLASALIVSAVGFGVLATAGGPPALPGLLLHVAAATITASILRPGLPSPVLWVVLLSLASMPPLPGFITKFALIAQLPPWAAAAALVGICLVGIGCARALPTTPDASMASRRTRWLAAIVAVLITVGLGWLPELAHEFAVRAATSLF